VRRSRKPVVSRRARGAHRSVNMWHSPRWRTWLVALSMLPVQTEEQAVGAPLSEFAPGQPGHLPQGCTSCMHMQSIYGATSAADCASHCLLNQGCLSFTYTAQGAECIVISGRSDSTQHQLITPSGFAAAGFSWWHQDMMHYNRWINGCMDPAANNYSPTADRQDGSCTYASGHWAGNGVNSTVNNSGSLLNTLQQAHNTAVGANGCGRKPCSNVTGLDNATVSCSETSTVAGFLCGPCPDGFLGAGGLRNGTGTVCSDEDDCLSRRGISWDPCGINGTGGIGCTDAGLLAYACVCRAGFEWLGSVTTPDQNATCTDIDDCGVRGAYGNEPCGAAAVACVDQGVDMYTCNCSVGYEWDGLLGHGCDEILPCTRNHSCHRSASCNHEGPGRYSCTCSNGYYGDGVDCTPFDACSHAGRSPRYADRGPATNLLLGDIVNPRSPTAT
jgi:hypothetical protein